MITKLAFVSHPVQDMERARKFYGEILGLKNTVNQGDFWSEYITPDGKTIAITSLHPAINLALEVDDLEAELARLKEQGVKVRSDFFDGQEVLVNEEICQMAFFEDSEGNVILLHQTHASRL